MTLVEKLPRGLKTESEILGAGYTLMRKEQGAKTARYYFCYNEDFPSDFLSDYQALETAAENDCPSV